MENYLQDLSVSTLWAQARHYLDRDLLEVSLGHLLLALAIILLSLLLRRPVASLVLRIARRWFGQDSAARLTTLLYPPAQVLAPSIGLLIVTNSVLGNTALRAIGQELTRSLIVFALFWALFRAIVPLFERLEHRSKQFTASMLGVAIAASRVTVLALGAATILEIWGINVGPVIAGFGLVGAAVALGAQDLFKNLIGGIFIIAERRFQIGDWIAAEGVCEGTVEAIGLRTTTVRQFDLSPIFVPNSQLSDNPLINYQQMTYRRISWMVELSYDSSIDQLRHVRDGIETYLRGNADFVQPPEQPIFVRIDSFGDSAINLMIYCFARTTDWEKWLIIKESFAMKISAIVAEAGTALALPSRSLYVEHLPKGVELFVPPEPRPEPQPEPPAEPK